MSQVIPLSESRGNIHGSVEIAKLTVPIVAIVNFVSERERLALAPGQRLVHYQVTLDASRLSPSGEFIRLGNTTGDEITGWQPVADIEVIEILCEVKTEGGEAGQLPALVCLRNRTLKMDVVDALDKPSPG